MKNKIFLITTILFFKFNLLLGDELKINAEKIKLDDNSKIVFLEGNVTAIDKNNNKLITDSAKYNKKNGRLLASGQTKIITSENYQVLGSNILFDDKNQVISSNEESKISDTNSRENIVYDPLNSRLFSFLYFAMLLPTTSLAIRRFHDINKSGWYILLPFTIIGIIPYYYFTSFVKGSSGENKYGTNPLEKNNFNTIQVAYPDEEE